VARGDGSRAGDLRGGAAMNVATMRSAPGAVDRTKVASAACALALGVLAPSSPATCPRYEVTATFSQQCADSFQGINGYGLNESGHAVGLRYCYLGPDHAFAWYGSGPFVVDVPMPPGTLSSRAHDVNDAGWIVGEASVSGVLGGASVAFVRDGTQTIVLGTLPGGNYSVAAGLNSQGQVVGYWGHNVTGPSPLAFLWEDGVMRSLEADVGFPFSQARDINDSGWITGWMSATGPAEARTFILANGAVIDLGPIPGGMTSEGRAINERGDVAGVGRVPHGHSFQFRAFYYSDGVARNLGTLPGYARSIATDLNDDRVVVGYCAESDHHTQADSAFVWQDGVMWNLNDLVVHDLTHVARLINAWAINDAGQILADAGKTLVLLSPAPLIGDLDCDRTVGFVDLLRLVSAWGECGSCDEDLDSDGTVGSIDLTLLLANWGQG
jgi:probable HAF family extracellular repeat protein